MYWDTAGPMTPLWNPLFAPLWFVQTAEGYAIWSRFWFNYLKNMLAAEVYSDRRGHKWLQ
jgi:hypothetical protein